MALQINNETENKIIKLIKNAKKIVILGIGEVTLGDDGFGPYITVHFLENNISFENILFINGGSVPESREEDILNFKPVLF